MIEISISCKELPQIIKMMERYPEMTNENIRDVFKIMLPEIERYAKMDAPVDTGRLRADIGTTFNEKELEGVVYNTVEYAIYVHEGTYKMKSRPYMRRAIFDQAAIKMKRELERNVLKDRGGLI